ncbi:MAG: helix-turn-helix transcriptional regulator [Candidatus Neomarinimicrobiota bacterium]|nr:helix-turn-helix transcriptional regulator [Candidatus Cloacimonadota bacterium]
MKKTIETKIITSPHKVRPNAREVEIFGIPQWKQDVFNLVAELIASRLKQKITQKELAERLNIKQSVVARFERLGRIPTIEFLYKIANGLGVQMEISTRSVEVPKVSETEKRERTEVSPYTCYYQKFENYEPALAYREQSSVTTENWAKGSIPGKVFFTAKDARLETAFIQDVEAIIKQISAFTSSDKSGYIPIYNVSATPENSFKEQPQEPEISNPVIDLAV